MMAFVERHLSIFLLMFLLIMLFSGHAFMIHASRPHEQITWVEGLIESVFSALLPILAISAKSQQGDK